MIVAVFRYPLALALAAWKRPFRPSMRALLLVWRSAVKNAFEVLFEG